MTAQREVILMPVSRLVQGSLYKAYDKDQQGRPMVYPAGHAKAGQPKINYFFAVAIAKQPGEVAWWNTPWGAKALAVAQAAWPGGQTQIPSFAWKIEDGDSTIPNKNNKKNCDLEGFPGNWIVNFGSSLSTKIYQQEGGRWAEWLQVDAIKLGDFVEVQASVSGNGNAQNPGIYMNPDMVAFRGYGPRIQRGPDPNAAGFGQSALPPGASNVPTGGPGLPIAGTMPPGAGMPSVPGQPVPGAAPPTAPIGSQSGMTFPSSPPQVPVQPSAAFIQPPGAPAAPSAPPAPPAAPVGPVMTAKAAGALWSAFVAKGWTEDAARQAGYIG